MAEGHTYAFGNTAESLRKLVFGLTQIGDPSDRAFDRTTGTGFVAACRGDYSDALAKGHGVSLHHAESTGAPSPLGVHWREIAVSSSRRRCGCSCDAYGGCWLSGDAVSPPSSTPMAKMLVDDASLPGHGYNDAIWPLPGFSKI